MPTKGTDMPRTAGQIIVEQLGKLMLDAANALARAEHAEALLATPGVAEVIAEHQKKSAPAAKKES